MKLLLSLRSFKGCEVQVEPQNQSLEIENHPEGRPTQNQNENHIGEEQNDKNVHGASQSNIIHVKPFERNQIM